MNTEKTMGSFIKELRKGKGWSQETLAEKLGFEGIATISNWETGKAKPDARNLEKMAKLFDVTINEIIIGHRTNSDFEQQYSIYRPGFLRGRAGKDLHSKINWKIEEVVRVRRRFKELVLNFVAPNPGKNVDFTENDELRFLFRNYYNLHNQTEADFFNLLLRLRLDGSKSPEEKWWEVSKCLLPIQELYSDPSSFLLNSGLNHEDRVAKAMEPWEKDALLLGIIRMTEEDRRRLARDLSYDKRSHDDCETFMKKGVRNLIGLGAMINKSFTDVPIRDLDRYVIMDYIDKEIVRLRMPIRVVVQENGALHESYVANTPFNRFILREKDRILKRYSQSEKTPQELYALLFEHQDIPEDLKPFSSNNRKKQNAAEWERARQELIDDHNQFDTFEQHLNSSPESFDDTAMCGKIWFRSSDYEEIRLESLEDMKRVSFQNFNKGRDITRTNELIENLDQWAWREIQLYCNWMEEKAWK